MTLPTLLAVHAHPDDESLFTAGATSLYHERGHRVVLVTCTYGQLGIDGAGRGGAVPGHDALGTRATRAQELHYAGDLVGFDRQISLGYLDSGMRSWPSIADPHAFANADVESVARIIAAIIDEEQVAVVLTYDDFGFYGHPDHIAAHHGTRRAVELSASAQRLFYPIMPGALMTTFQERAAREGVFMPAWVTDAGMKWNADDVDTTIDALPFAPRKQRAIDLHHSQSDNADLVTMPSDMFSLLLGTEYYHLGWQRTDAPVDPTDFFGGLA